MSCFLVAKWGIIVSLYKCNTEYSSINWTTQLDLISEHFPVEFKQNMGDNSFFPKFRSPNV